eukprot:360412-Chlamydomonas_euryale.AAC.1
MATNAISSGSCGSRGHRRGCACRVPGLMAAGSRLSEGSLGCSEARFWRGNEARPSCSYVRERSSCPTGKGGRRRACARAFVQRATRLVVRGSRGRGGVAL